MPLARMAIWRRCSRRTTHRRGSRSSPGPVCERARRTAGRAGPTLSPYARILGGGDPGAIPAVREGRAGVQDEGSQLVAIALADAEVDGLDERWLDLCAGPGGKAALLGGLASQRGATLVARDAASPGRPGPPGRRSGLSNVVTADGRDRPWEGVVRPGARGCAVLGPRCAPARPEARWRRHAATCRTSCRCNATCSGALDSCVQAAWSST